MGNRQNVRRGPRRPRRNRPGQSQRIQLLRQRSAANHGSRHNSDIDARLDAVNRLARELDQLEQRFRLADRSTTIQPRPANQRNFCPDLGRGRPNSAEDARGLLEVTGETLDPEEAQRNLALESRSLNPEEETDVKAAVEGPARNAGTGEGDVAIDKNG